jgi:hypothetical protein
LIALAKRKMVWRANMASRLSRYTCTSLRSESQHKGRA